MFSKAYCITPDDGEVITSWCDYLIKYAEVVHQSDYCDKAIALLEKLLANHPDYTGIQNGLGVAHAIKGKLEKSKAAYQRAFEYFEKELVVNKERDVVSNYTSHLNAAGRLTGKDTYFYRAINFLKGFGDTTEANYDLACSYQLVGSLDDSLHYLTKFLEATEGNMAYFSITDWDVWRDNKQFQQLLQQYNVSLQEASIS